MHMVCLDLEGVLIPEVWINVAERSGIDELRLTTRDVPDYDELMTRRLAVLDRHGLGIADIRAVIDTMAPLDGARAFLDALREHYQVLILSDTFYEFADPFMRSLGRPTLLCHRLEIDAAGRVTGYRLRLDDQKRRSVEALRSVNVRTIAAGDSYNDTTMLAAADAGILFRPPANVIAEFPRFPVTETYEALRAAVDTAAARLPL